jgi:hypothetical protein
MVMIDAMGAWCVLCCVGGDFAWLSSGVRTDRDDDSLGREGRDSDFLEISNYELKSTGSRGRPEAW